MKTLFTYFLLLFINSFANGQVLEKCMTEVLGVAEFGSVEAYYRNQASYQEPLSSQRTLVTIPIVVHVVWHEAEENITDLQIQSQIASLNLDFSARNDAWEFLPSEYEDLSMDSGWQFCLAKVERKYTPTKTVGLAVDSLNRKIISHAEYGGLDPWEGTQYLNVWIGKMPKGTLGYFFTEFGNVQGIVIDPYVFGTIGTVKHKPNNALGKTLTHEIGHFFGLNHIWGFGCEIDDGIADTPPQAEATAGCPNWPEWSCDGFDMYMNFMDYSDDRCLTMFTQEQIQRMEQVRQSKYPKLGETECASIELEKTKANVFPNPAADYLVVSLSGKRKSNEISIYSAVGKLLYRTLTAAPAYLNIPVGKWASGVYYLQIKTDQELHTQKVLVLH